MISNEIKGMLGLSQAMGIGRFVFTPILPFMLTQIQLNSTAGAQIAAANYLGYFIGSIFCIKWAPNPSLKIMRLALITEAISIFLMGFTNKIAWFLLMRIIAGIAAAIIFIAMTGVAILATKNNKNPGIIFSGVGLGITVSGIFISLFSSQLNWNEMWFGAGILALILALPVWNIQLYQNNNLTSTAKLVKKKVNLNYVLLIISYFLEGAGYIIIATFMVTLFYKNAGSAWGMASWIIVGLAAIPATILWAQIAMRINTLRSLMLAYILQTSSAFIAALTENRIAIFWVAILFGGTFMGITMLSIQTGIKQGFENSGSFMTLFYGIGQILGPVLATTVNPDKYSQGFIFAGILLALATIIVVWLYRTCFKTEIYKKNSK